MRSDRTFAGVSGNPLPDLPHYLTPGPVPGASVDAAIAAAVHATLSALFPSQKAFFDLEHAQAGLQGPGLTEGHDFGLKVAQKLLEDRQDDPNTSDDGYASSIVRGAHRPDPDNPLGYHAPFDGAKSKCFAVTARHELDAPPKLDTPEYVRALQQMRRRGIAPELMGTLPPNSPRRTGEQTVIGIYWGYDGAAGLGMPPRLYNQIVRAIAIKKPNPHTGGPNTAAENARLFALVNVAMADAGILAWDQKHIHDLWRPVVGIREHDISMGLGSLAPSVKYDSTPLPAAPMALEKSVHSLPLHRSCVEHVTPSIVGGDFYPVDSWMISRLCRLGDHGRTTVSVKFRTGGARDPGRSTCTSSINTFKNTVHLD